MRGQRASVRACVRVCVRVRSASSSLMSHAFHREAEMETKKLFISLCKKPPEEISACARTAGWADTSQGSDQREEDKSICAERNSCYSLSSSGAAAGAGGSPLIQRHLSNISQWFP